jgi:hypothetical protein
MGVDPEDEIRRMKMEDIGTHGLRGGSSPYFGVTIAGPCGDGHSMNWAAVKELRDWLDEKLRQS